MCCKSYECGVPCPCVYPAQTGDLPGFSEFPLPQYVQLAACLLWLRGSSGTGRGMGHGAGTVQRGQSKAVSKHRHPLALGWSTYIHEVR